MKAFLPEQTRITQVQLRTAKLERAAAFYTKELGLKIVRGPDLWNVEKADAEDGVPAGKRVELSAQAVEATDAKDGGVTDSRKPVSVVLCEDLDAAPRPPRSLGLYHFALRYPSRHDLAQAYHRLVKNDYPVAGAADHGVSEAIYLSDPDGNGVELYADRPDAQWPRQNGHILMETKPVELEDLSNAASSESLSLTVPAGVGIGHIHLQVPDLEAAERFFSGFLGLAVTHRLYPGAMFFANGGYHHQIAVNVWAGRMAPPANSVGLISYRIEVPITEILYCLGHRAPLLGYETHLGSQVEGARILQIRDPSGSWLEIQAPGIESYAGISCP